MRKVQRYSIICKECNKETMQPIKNKRMPMFCNIDCYSQWLKINQRKKENHHSWKGDKAGYSTKHKIIYREFGKANKCENEKCTRISKIFNWANLSGQYKRDRSDWKMLCRSCHMLLDFGRNKERFK